jgi:hypothetical protein
MLENLLARVGAPEIGLRERLGVKVTKTWQTFHKSGRKLGGRKREQKQKARCSRANACELFF